MNPKVEDTIIGVATNPRKVGTLKMGAHLLHFDLSMTRRLIRDEMIYEREEIAFLSSGEARGRDALVR